MVRWLAYHLVAGIAFQLLAASQHCKHAGQRFVQDFIQFQCTSNDGGELQLKPIGCVPSNLGNGSAIPPGLSYSGRHFRYECEKKPSGGIQLKVTHCIDDKGSIIAIGEFFTVTDDDGENVSVECLAEEDRVKKVIFKWKKCQLENGAQLTEGNFITQQIPEESLRTVLQKEEIISCQRSGADVELECTGCVASNGIHVAVAAYSKVQNQWVQCRRVLGGGCRLVNVTDDYINCKFEGRSYEHGGTFQSKSGRSEYVCDYGAVIKTGCIIGGEVVRLGAVQYVDSEPQLCQQVDQPLIFRGVRGCEITPTFTQKFMETWRDGQVLKRCSFRINQDNSVEPEIVEYGCWYNREVIPLNKVIQGPQGTFKKCDKNDKNQPEIRDMNAEEVEVYLKRKSSHLNLVEYVGLGGRGELRVDQHDEPTCRDYLPFCKKLANYCAGESSNVGLMIEAYEEHDQMQRLFERLAGVKKVFKKPIGCEAQLAPFRKFQLLVEVSCQRTCKRCIVGERVNMLLDNLEHTSHCGR